MVFLKHIPDAFISFSYIFLWSLVGGIVVFYDQNLRKNDIIRKQKKIFNLKKKNPWAQTTISPIV